jgi:hypothetical protein
MLAKEAPLPNRSATVVTQPWNSVEDQYRLVREHGATTNNIAAQIEKTAQMSEENSAAARKPTEAASSL